MKQPIIKKQAPAIIQEHNVKYSKKFDHEVLKFVEDNLIIDSST